MSRVSTASAGKASPPRPELEALAQKKYEKTFLAEISKLHNAINDERKAVANQKAQLDEEQKQDRNRKAWEEDKAQKMRAMEQAIVYAQQQDQKRFLRRVRAAPSSHSTASLPRIGCR